MTEDDNRCPSQCLYGQCMELVSGHANRHWVMDGEYGEKGYWEWTDEDPVPKHREWIDG